MKIEEIDSDQDTEEEKIEIPLSKRKIYTDQADPQIDSLYNKRKRGKLVLQPDFQRRFVWDHQKSSRLMESALLGLPLPMIYLSEEKDGKEYVIDGQQRLTSFFSFIDGKFPDGGLFKLTGLDAFPEYEGKSFSDLDEELQEKIMYCKIRTVTFSKDTDEDLKFEIYKKLNTGVVVLNDQELRNCIYNGEYSKLLKQLSEDKDFMSLLGLEDPHPRMSDVELVLRFAAFYHSTYLKYKSPMKKFFNDDMRKFQHISEYDRAELVTCFKNAVAIIRSMFGEGGNGTGTNHAFRRFYEGNDKNKDGNWEPNKFNHALYDILMFSFAKADKNKVYHNLDAIREALIYLMTSDREFINTIEHSTSTVQSVTKRFKIWTSVLDEIIGIKKEPRCFTFQLKQELYNNDQTCKICGNKIQNIDDATIDHIEQYWTGGKTIQENARLTHRYCNLARSRYDEKKAEYQTEKAGHQTEKAEHQTEKAGHQTEKAGHQTEKAGHQTEKAGHQTEKTGHQTEKAGHQTEKAEESGEKTYAQRITLQQLTDTGLVKNGQTLYFFHGRMFNDEQAEIVVNQNRLKYKKDGKLYSISELAAIIDRKVGLKHDYHSVAGPKYWKTEDGKLLHDLNEQIRKKL